jgi:hypothetical protein
MLLIFLVDVADLSAPRRRGTRYRVSQYEPSDFGRRRLVINARRFASPDDAEVIRGSQSRQLSRNPRLSGLRGPFDGLSFGRIGFAELWVAMSDVGSSAKSERARKLHVSLG